MLTIKFSFPTKMNLKFSTQRFEKETNDFGFEIWTSWIVDKKRRLECDGELLSHV